MRDPGRHDAPGWRWIGALLIAILLLSAAAPNLSPPRANASTPVATSATPSPAASPASAAAILDHTTISVAFPMGLSVTGELELPDGSGVVSLQYAAGYDAGWSQVDLPEAALSRNADGTTALNATIDLQALLVPLGATLTIRWVAETPGGLAVSAPSTVVWHDTRQPWQEFRSEQVVLHVYGMDETFAQEILASAQGTITDLERRYRLQRSEPLSLWIYPEAEAFREGLPANFRESVVGGSVVGFPLIVAVIPPGSSSEVGRVIPHEISHQVLFQATRNPFSLLPTWFDEGMATHVQIGGTGGYMGMVIAAERNDALFDLASLSGSFPYTPSQATLAYAASWSAVAFILDRWGEDGIADLIAAFAEGMPEDQAIEQALGMPMAQFTAEWKGWIAAQA